MKKKKVYELKIDLEDEISGIDSISIVEDAAIEVDFLAFNKQHKCEHFDDLKYVQMFDGIGESEQSLFDDGWVIDSIEEVKLEEFGLAPTNPNVVSVDDEDFYRVRYKYDVNPNINQNPIIPTTREYCRTLINKNFVFTREELMSLPPNNDPEDGGNGRNPMYYRAGWNCRHWWYKIKYKKEGKIINKASVNINKETDVAGRAVETNPNWHQPSTITSTTANNPSSSTIKNLGLSKVGFATESEEKRIIVSPAMIPDLEIYRRDMSGNEYYVYFSKETIAEIAEKYMKNGYNVANDVDHDGKRKNNIYILESWIKESDIDKSNVYSEFKDLPIGTWFVKMKINDDETWNRIKNGELRGVSVSGYFSEELVQMKLEEQFIEELAKILNMKRGN